MEGLVASNTVTFKVTPELNARITAAASAAGQSKTAWLIAAAEARLAFIADIPVEHTAVSMGTATMASTGPREEFPVDEVATAAANPHLQPMGSEKVTVAKTDKCPFHEKKPIQDKWGRMVCPEPGCFWMVK